MAAGEQANFQAEKRYVHADGDWVWASLSASIVHDLRGRPLYFVSQMEDVTQRKNAEDQLAYLADHDPLTGLYNLRRFRQELDRGVAHSHRYHRPLALLAIDLDNFKQINDTLGHAAGDEVLRRTAQLLEARLRRTDVLGRLGGDEFAAILPETDYEMARIVAADVLQNMHVITLGDRQPFGWLSASVGIAGAANNGGTDADRLLAVADAAMYEAKRSGRDRFAIAFND
jgi:diguanylate cyclase (GGDEF)-like protein